MSDYIRDQWGAEQGFPGGPVYAITQTADGYLWIGTEKGLVRFDGFNFRLFNHANSTAFPPGPVLGLMADAEGNLWIRLQSRSLLRYRGGTFQEALPDLVLPEDGVTAMCRGKNGEALLVHSNGALRYRGGRFVMLASKVKRHRSVVADPLGRIWFSTNRGVSVVDPHRMTGSSVPALVHLEGISADGSPNDLRVPVRIPAARQRIIFSYAGLSLAVPERVRFRYKLDGFDQGWSEPVAAREAVYTNLDPGSYRFRVMASNSDGLWNGAEATIGLEVLPLFWQTWWFQFSTVLLGALAILAFYRLRMRQLTRRLNVRFEERLAERMRIAHELHDTLLQGFLSASMQLHLAADRLPEDSPAKPLVSRVLELMGRVIDEGRNAVRGLRSEHRESLDLEQAFSRIQEELAISPPVGFRVLAEGVARPLHPLIRDEVYRIGREAVVNAFRHSRATRIEVELEYAAKHLRLLVRDNGCGIDPQVLRSGREGHWGLSGMRERAEEIGARLKVWSRDGAGTEVELSVPSQIAFEVPSSQRPLRWFARWSAAKSRSRGSGRQEPGEINDRSSSHQSLQRR